jgi:hypothetical protein
VSPPLPRITLRERAHAGVDYVFTHAGALPWVAAALLNAASLVLGILAGQKDFTNHEVALLVAAGVCLVAAAAVTYAGDRVRRTNEQSLTQVGAESQLTMTDALQPILRRLAILVHRTTPQRPDAFQKVVGAVLQSLPTLFPDVDGVRMVIFRQEAEKNKRKRLAVEDFAGRPKDEPKPFVMGEGDRPAAVFTWLSEGKSRFVPNIDLESDPNWKGSGRGYRTFISVPVIADGVIYGMLTIDAPSPGDLDETDVPVLEVLGHCLAAAYAINQK